MAALNVVGYKPGSSLLHRLDPRTKQIVVMVQSGACFVGGVPYLLAITAGVVFFLVQSRIGAARLLSEIRYFLFFVLFVFVVRAMTLSEHYIPTSSMADVQGAFAFCWRLLLVAVMGVLLISTTRTADIRAALVWLLRPVPFVNERTAATMVGLVVRLVPLILFQAGEIGDAMRSRCIEERRKPLLRMNTFTITLFRRAFSRADDLVDSMQARCYSEHRTVRTMNFTRIDMLVMVSTMLLLAVLLMR